MSDRIAIIYALEALEDGDVRGATESLLAAMEDALRPIGVRCDYCGQRYDWPGLLDAHLRLCNHEVDYPREEAA
jgi:hypothetical protein